MNEVDNAYPGGIAAADGSLGSSNQTNLKAAHPRPETLTDASQKEFYQAVLKDAQSENTDFGEVSMVYNHDDLPKMKVTYDPLTAAAVTWDTDIILATPGTADSGLPASPFMPDLCVNSTNVHPGTVHDFKPSGWASSADDADLVSAGAGVTGPGVMLDPSVSRQRIALGAIIGTMVMGSSGAVPETTED
jgi:hypothetical protein